MANKGMRNTARKKTSLNISDDKVFDAVKKRAYELYCQRGCAQGNDKNDWFEAERQIKHETGMTR